jgi:hypothetical protein
MAQGFRLVGGESHELLLSDVSALLEEPLSGEALPTWRFTARRSLRSAASQEHLQLSGMLEERSSGSGRYPTYPKERGPTVIREGVSLCHAGTIALFLDTRSHLLE